MIQTKIQLRLIALLTLLIFASTSWAQTVNPLLYRYVKTGGAYANDGKTWANAKNNVQDAINDLHDYMVKAGITQGGKVFVAAGTYYPTETTETTGGSQLGMSFKIYAGITVEGGYPAKASEGAKKNATTNKTTFSGNLTSTATFTWNSTKQQYNTQFPGNVYHVVWFATNGFDANGRANALTSPATLDGIVIEGGRAYNTDLVSKHPHNAYGAGIYAVAGAEIINCEVLHCEASRDGAGIYLDGGGTVRNCHIHQCQTLGLGIKYGRGGAICIDGGGLVERTVMTNNMAREGGALAIYERGTCVASLLTNNTSTTEAGGAYLKDGGVLSGVSVMRNRCNGSGAVIDGITTGKSGGVFAVGPARIYNSALWGNQVGENGDPATHIADTYDDLQFSAYTAEGQQGSALYYVAMNNNDRVNWSHTSTRGMVSLATPNTGSEASLHYINLGDGTKNPSTVAGVITDGKDLNTDNNYHTTYSFKPKAISALVNAGIQLSDIPAEDKVGAEDAAITTDITNSPLSPLCDLGAYLAQTQTVAFATTIANQEGNDATTKTLFVDPNRSTTITQTNVGNSWDAPLANLRDALGYVRADKNNPETPAGTKYQILCKEGILYTSGTATSERLAQSSIYMIDDVAVYGGYPSALTGTNLSNGNFQRDPVEYPTIISGSIIAGDYDKNTAHLVNFSNVNNAILDGFQLRYGNASASSDNNTIQNAIDWGAGIIFTNMFEYNGTALGIATVPHYMYGNAVRNTIITGCTARSGAAIYTHMIDGMNGELSLYNCILHNNSVIYGKDGDAIPAVTAAFDRSIIHVSEGVTLNMNHCDVLRNVGYGIYAANKATVNIYNSMFYANLDRPVDNTNEFDVKPSTTNPKAKLCAPIRKDGTASITGDNNMFDYLFSNTNASSHAPACFSADNFESLSMTGTNNQCNLTYSLVNNDNYTYPKFENPTRNSGVSPDGDVTFYGNATSFMPLSMSPLVNAADPTGQTSTDLTTTTTRSYGGAPDIGAMENDVDQLESGVGMYVRDYTFTTGIGTKTLTYDKDEQGYFTLNEQGKGVYDAGHHLLDGSSWRYAINGNGEYGEATNVDVSAILYAENDSRTKTDKDIVYTIKGAGAGNSTSFVSADLKPTTSSNAAQFKFYLADTPVQFNGSYYMPYYIRLTDGSTEGNYVSLAAGKNLTAGDKAVFAVNGTIRPEEYVLHYSQVTRFGVLFTRENDVYTATDKNWDNRGDGTYFIYNGESYVEATESNSKSIEYVIDDNGTYIKDNENGNYTSDSNNKNSITFAQPFIFVGTPANFDIIPVASIGNNAGGSQISWNWNGGVSADNIMGTWGMNDGNSAWTVGTGETGTRFKLKDTASNKYVGKTLTARTDVDGWRGLSSTTDEAQAAQFTLSGDVLKLWDGATSYGAAWGTRTGYLAIAFNSSWNYPNFHLDSRAGDGKYYIYLANGSWYFFYWHTIGSTEYLDAKYLGRIEDAQSQSIVKWEVIYEDANPWSGSLPENSTISKSVIENSSTGLQYAIDNASQVFKEGGSTADTKREVWVAKGTYKGNFIMKEGADVLGGFPTVGNPGKKERNISNNDDLYNTILDANSSGTVVNYQDLFTVETMMEGLTIRGGDATVQGGGVIMPNKGVLKNCLVTENHTTGAGGAGIFIPNGNQATIMNCVVSKNIVDHQGQYGGGGIYIPGSGSVLINTLVVENVAKGNTNITGAGVRCDRQNNFYNCTVAFNMALTNNAPAQGGFWDMSGVSNFYNCIMWGNTANGNTKENFFQVGMPGYSAGAGKNNDHFFNCYHSTNVNENASDNYSENSKVYVAGTGNSYSEYAAFALHCAEHHPFVGTFTFNTETNTYVNKQGYEAYNLAAATGASLSANCINKGGSEPVLQTAKVFEDITGAERIQDCTVDKGAYEYNGAADITPTVTDIKDASDNVIGHTATYYVTEAGTGTASAENASNAACSQKLQKVLDAAGRYKYAHPTHKVKVLLGANKVKVLQDKKTEIGTYSPRRTADQVDVENARSWSLMVPRGVEVYGGYVETTFAEDTRNAITNKTILDGVYKRSQEESQSIAYHVVTFTDRVFDAHGLPYLKDDSVFNNSAVEPSHYDTSNEDYTDADLLLLSNVTMPGGQSMSKAILDGLFIQNGRADGISTAGFGTNANSNGGGAIVPNYAHIRNCIVQNNAASEYGGGLYLMPGAAVTGSLIKENSAKQGGGLSFAPMSDEEKERLINMRLSTSIKIYMLAQVSTSTIVDNTASGKGGGVWFDWNAKLNSTVIWGNHCGDQTNVSGQTGAFPFANSDNDTPYDMYPFAYSAVENNKFPGPNNQSVSSENKNGVRFATAEGSDAFAEENSAICPYYAITDYSVLNKRGSSISSYEQAKTAGDLSDNDFNGVPREATGYARIDIGCRALAGTKVLPTKPEDILLRLFVVNPNDVNMTAMQALKGSDNGTYNQKGSSFAYPFQTLDEAIEYILDVRKSPIIVEGTSNPLSYYAANLPFEIIMAGGTYTPDHDIYDNQGVSYANTFLIPEGVTIIGGLHVGQEAQAKYFYGQNRKALSASSDTYSVTPSASKGVDACMFDNTQEFPNTPAINGYTMEQDPTTLIKSRRKHTDNNANDIIEPWEFQFQTILSGHVINSQLDENVYHVVTVIADENRTGKRPTPLTNSAYTGNGQSYSEQGASVELNGIQVNGGQAYSFYDKALSDGFMSYGYFVGGGVYVDGNWYSDADKTPKYKHRDTAHAKGYRDIHLVIDRCQFLGNEAGCGGAIATTSTLSVYNSSFENNLAWGGADTNVPVGEGEALPVFNNNVPAKTMSVNYPGFGGAIYGTSTITCLNTVFANNEATYGDIGSETPIKFTEPSEPNNTMLFIPGQGGAVYAGANAQVQATNCDFVRNKAVAFPSIFLTSPNTYQMGKTGTAPTGGNYNKVFNSVFWGNEGTAKNSKMAFAKNLNINFARHTIATEQPTTVEKVYAQYASSQTDLDDNFAQGMWFCAYEKGTGQTPVNTLDVRKASIDLESEAYVGDALKTYATASPNGLGLTDPQYTEKGYQDANVIISSDNAAIDGPNFTNPSHLAGNEGYMQDADWMPLRINLLTDGGWGYVKQEAYDSEKHGSTAPTDGTGVVFTTDKGETIDNDVVVKSTNGIFSALQAFNSDRVSFKETTYMLTAQSPSKNIYRISKVPAPFFDDYDYVDIGVYEYQYQKLIQGDHVDYLWITENEDLSAGNDGSTWQKATSDVQRAIETLLASRCGHDKYLFVKEGKYKPLTKYDENLGYTINTGALNTQATTISTSSRGISQSIPSLTILGGFSNEVETTFEGYDQVQKIIAATNPETHPTIFYADDDDSNTLFNIVDARQWYATGSTEVGNDALAGGSGSTLKGTDDKVSVIPITIDGLRFHNPHGMTGGVAINYGEMKKSTSKDEPLYAGEPIIKMITSGSGNSLTTSVEATTASDHFPKLTLRRCIFHANGKADATGNVVKIGQGGCYALIANSLFDNNNTTGYTLNTHDAKIVNCTFANNKAGINMTGTTKTIDNSIMWRNGGTEVSGDPAINNSAVSGYNIVDNNSDGIDDNGNSALSNDNEDLATGPNFADPANGDYHLRPSLTILNKVTVADEVYKNITGVAPANDTDLAGNPRLHSTNLDLGAYEYQQALQRIIFYDPNKVTAGDGTDWQTPYSYGNFQNAIDMAAVYHGANTSQTAYVFAKGGKDGRKTDETITLRNGVEVMGSINPSETVSSITKDKPAITLEMKDATEQTDINTYIQTVIANKRPGLLCPSTSRTIIDGLATQGTYDAQTSIDNIYVEGNLNVLATANPSDATANVLLRNMVVTGGTASIQGAIAYNTLFFNNTSAPSLAANAYALHCTSAEPFTVTTANARYCNTNAFANRSWDSFAALNYQLPYNNSTCIDKGEASFTAPDAIRGLSVINNIDFDDDRDLLGNSRRIGDKADYGAFEAWRVAENTTVTARADNEAYPHEGTNVIIEEGASLILDNDLKAANIGFLPGYLHVMKGGSLYAQNNNVTAANVSVQMTINKEGSVVSLPYDHDYSTQGTAYTYNAAKRSQHDYDFAAANSACWEPASGVVPANTGVLFVPNSSDWGTAKTRSMVFNSKGANPTDWVYTESSDELYRTITLTQNNHTPNDGSSDFTTKEDMGWNCIGLPYLVSNYKPYERANTADATTVASPTGSEPYRMNLPHTLWLYYNGTVGPDGKDVNGNGGFYSVNSWESTKDAWHVSTDAEASLWTGEGIFLQTATLANTEDITFYRPAYVAPSSAPARRQAATRYYTGSDFDEQNPDDASNAELIATEYYTTGGARITAPLHHGVTIIRNRYSDGTSRTSKLYRNSIGTTIK